MINPLTPSESPSTELLGATDTRSRILQAAQRLFRKRGYHATGLNDILELAQAPKGSMYHHFPAGKEEIGVCVIENITAGLLGLFAQSSERTTQAMVAKVGEQLVVVAEKTQFEICALYAAFVAERKTSPLLGQAVATAYGQMLDALQVRLLQDGMSKRVAKEKSQLVVAMLEGGSLLAQARQDASLFRAAVKQAARICALATSVVPRLVGDKTTKQQLLHRMADARGLKLNSDDYRVLVKLTPKPLAAAFTEKS